MSRTRVQQTQISGSLSYSDNLAAGVALAAQPTLVGDLNALRSQLNKIIGVGNWYDELAGTQDLADIQGAMQVTGADAAFQGDVSAVGDMSAVDGTFSGNLAAVDATLSGDLAAVSGSFSGNVSIAGDVAQRLYIVGADGEIKDESKLTFDGSALAVDGDIKIADDAMNAGRLYMVGPNGEIASESKLAFVGQITGWELNVDGSIVSDGQISAASGSFSGNVSAVDATLSGNLSAVDGTFSGNLSAVDATLSGDLAAVDATLSGDLSAVGGTFSGNVAAVDGTFSGDLAAVDATLSGDLSAVGGTFSGNLAAVDATLSGDLAAVDATLSGDLSAVGGTFSGNIAAVDATLSGDLAAVDATLSGDLSAVGGTFSGNVSAVDGTFSGDLSAVDGAFSGDVSAQSLAIAGDVAQRLYIVDADGTIKDESKLTFDGSELAIDGNLSAADAVFSGNVQVDGDLRVKGSMTYIDTQNMRVQDAFIYLATGSAGTTDSGIVLHGGAGAGVDLVIGQDGGNGEVIFGKGNRAPDGDGAMDGIELVPAWMSEIKLGGVEGALSGTFAINGNDMLLGATNSLGLIANGEQIDLMSAADFTLFDSNFTSTSIVGALNELYAAGAGGSKKGDLAVANVSANVLDFSSVGTLNSVGHQYVDVYLNGVLLSSTVDLTAVAASSVTLSSSIASELTNDDVLTVVLRGAA